MVTVNLFRFQVEVSDIPRAVYESLDFRVAQHPSEGLPYLLTRVLAYVLNEGDGLSFSAEGLGNPDAAALSSPDAFGGVRLWIEIGNPSPRKLHKASKTAKEVKVYTYKNPELLIREVQKEKVHRSGEIEVYSFSAELIEELSNLLEKDNRWSLLHDDGLLTIQIREKSVSGEVRRHFLPEA